VRGFAIALNRGCSGQDPFVIAIAMVKSGTVVTEEKLMATSPSRKFPMSATRSAWHCLTPIEYIEAQGWTFSACAAAGDRTPVRQRAKNLPRQARTGWTGRHRPDMQTSLTWTYGTQQNTSPHCPLPWGSSGRRFKSCQPNQEKCALTCYDAMVVNTK
jgi:hypothetical protein